MGVKEDGKRRIRRKNTVASIRCSYFACLPTCLLVCEAGELFDVKTLEIFGACEPMGSLLMSSAGHASSQVVAVAVGRGGEEVTPCANIAGVLVPLGLGDSEWKIPSNASV